MNDEDYGTELDSYGPGTDLMISLFAVAILLLSIVGAGQQFEAFAASGTPNRPDATAEPRSSPPPLKLVSRAEFEALQGRYERQLALEAELRAQIERRTADLERSTRQLEEMRVAAGRAPVASQNVGDHLDLVEFEIPVTALMAFFDEPETLSVSLEAETRRRMSEKAKTFPADANELLIETFVPFELFALAPDRFDDERALSLVYRISARLAEAYRRVLAEAGIPLACLRVSAGAFDRSPEVRRKTMRETIDGSVVMDELATFSRLRGASAATGDAVATVRILQGLSKNKLCNPDLLADQLSRL